MKHLFLLCHFFLPAILFAQTFTHADTLRGSISPERTWWDATHYDLHVTFDYANRSLSGWNTISYKTLQPHQILQLDLMAPLILDSVVQDGKRLAWRQDGNAYFIELQQVPVAGESKKITAFYHGNPVIAQRPPWDGGVIFAKDDKGRPWISVACQGVGGSIWYPNKDHQYDEPDSAALHVTCPNTMTAVSNGRMRNVVVSQRNQTRTWSWADTHPINNYNLIPNIGHYTRFSDKFAGEKGELSLDFWVMDYNLEKAKSRFLVETPKMLKCFEHWFGAFPFYADGFKIVESPHLGMEHQTAIAYGNHFQNGYLGRDLSATGWGLKWDFILVHESGHEWFGNNISTKDIADMWVHEGFTNYSETLYTGCEFGEEAATAYNVGCRRSISNDVPIIGTYNVNREGSGDMYYKGGSLLHTIRQVIGDDEKFRQILRGLNQNFALQTVTTEQVERYVSEKAGRDFSKVFDQYLRTTQVPVLEYKLEPDKKKKGKAKLFYRWTNCVAGFDLPVKVNLPGKGWRNITPTETWQETEVFEKKGDWKFEVEKAFYVEVKQVER
ncbi:MAG: M1 family metallopeptidase [Bacteroidota bacterium]